MAADNQFTIPASAWTDFVAKIAKLNKRAKKLGCEPITYNVIEETFVRRQHTFKTEDGEYTKEYMVPARVIELHGSAPRIEGWQFVARIEYLSDRTSMLFHSVPGTDIKIDERFRSLTPATCEHCKRVRSRKDTFVVRNVETGQQTQVGRREDRRHRERASRIPGRSRNAAIARRCPFRRRASQRSRLMLPSPPSAELVS